MRIETLAPKPASGLICIFPCVAQQSVVLRVISQISQYFSIFQNQMGSAAAVTRGAG